MASHALDGIPPELRERVRACLERLAASGDPLMLEAAGIILGLEQSRMIDRAIPNLFRW